MNNTEESRRAFIKKSGVIFTTGTLGLMSLAGCDSAPDDMSNDPGDPVATGIAFSGNTLTVDLAIQTGLRSSGAFLLVNSVGGQAVKVFIVNKDGTDIKAFTSICTHQACDVNAYNSSTERIMCPCHGSEFDLDGSPVSGPAPSALEEYSVTRSGDVLTVTL